MPTISKSGTIGSLFKFSSDLDEFVPVVKLDKTSSLSGALAAMVTGPKISLSDSIDEDKRKIDLEKLVVVPRTTILPFKVEKGVTTLDKEGNLTPKLSGDTTNIAIFPDKPTKATFGTIFNVNLEVKGNAVRHFKIEFQANDNSDDANQGELRDIYCGRVDFETYPDVFSEEETNRLIDEINFIKPFADAKSPPEYAGNYCMSAAERGLSQLLGNIADFYSVDRSHSKLKDIDFNKKGAKDRAAVFQNLGFVHSTIIFNDYYINDSLVKATKTPTDFQANAYNAVTLPSGSDLGKKLLNSMDGKTGFHLFYISVTDDFHTLLLVVDTRIEGNGVYTIYDQHGKTSSFGKLTDIEAGFARQTSWTFLNFYMNNGFKSKVTTRIWKIQRNS